MRSPSGWSSRRPLAVLVLAAAVAAALLATTPASAANDRAAGPALTVTHPAPKSPAGLGTPAEDRGKGLVWNGLAARQAACPHELTVVGVATPMCSHGPDPAEPGIDIRHRPTTTELAGTVTDGTAATAGQVPCYGDG